MATGGDADGHDDPVERLNGLIAGGVAQYLALAVVRGKMTETEAREEQARNERASKLRKTAISKWPAIDVAWDVSPDSFHLALDAVKPVDFGAEFPSVEVVGVHIEDLHSNLLPASQRVKDPLSSPYKSKSARLVAHLERGGLVTPAFVRHIGTGLYFAGGNHRVGWARYRQQGNIPILIVSPEKQAIQSVLSSLSEWP